jgi:glycine cleavage system transcriptional repressor
MMLVVDAPSNADELRASLEASAGPLGVTVTVSDVEEGAPDRPIATHVVSVYGSDHPGIVAGIAEALAGAKANITELSCRLTSAEQPVYVMVAEVAIPADVDPDRLAADVAATGRGLGVDVSFSPIDVETL